MRFNKGFAHSFLPSLGFPGVIKCIEKVQEKDPCRLKFGHVVQKSRFFISNIYRRQYFATQIRISERERETKKQNKKRLSFSFK